MFIVLVYYFDLFMYNEMQIKLLFLSEIIVSLLSFTAIKNKILQQTKIPIAIPYTYSINI